VRVVSFTGSIVVGKLLMRRCAGTVKKVALEFGGNAPFIIFADADLDAAVEGAMVSKFRNTGQTCVWTNGFYVHADIYEAFVEKLAVAIGKLRVGDGSNEGASEGLLINEAAVAKVDRHVADVLSKRRLVAGGKRLELRRTFFEPTVIANANSNMELAREETFGPLAAGLRTRVNALLGLRLV
jgi:succinate-semialdehyde dehydrogenase/glutarate-semialdehyde dehydrogenase